MRTACSKTRRRLLGVLIIATLVPLTSIGESAKARTASPKPAVASLKGARKAAADVAKGTVTTTERIDSLRHPHATRRRDRRQRVRAIGEDHGHTGGHHRAPPPVHAGRDAWVFWFDLAPGQNFAHPSKLLIIGASDRKLLTFVDMAFFPTFNGAPAPFITDPYNRNLRIFVNGPGAGTVAAKGAAAGGARAPAAPQVPKLPQLGVDCMIVVYDASDMRPSNFSNDRDALIAFGNSVGLTVTATPDPDTLDALVASAVARGCKDVAISLNGHGVPAQQAFQMLVNGKPSPFILIAESPEATVVFPVPRADGGEPVTKVLTSSKIREIVARHAQTTFKLLVNSCFAGRFNDDLADLTTGSATSPKRIVFLGTAAPSHLVSIQNVDGEVGKPSFWTRSFVRALQDVSAPIGGQATTADLPTLLTQAAAEQREDPIVLDAKGNRFPKELVGGGPFSGPGTNAATPPVLVPQPATPPVLVPQPATPPVPRAGLAGVLQRATGRPVSGNALRFNDGSNDVFNRPGSAPSANPGALDLEVAEIARATFGDILTCAPPNTTILAVCGGRVISLPREVIAMYVRPGAPIAQSSTVGVGFAWAQKDGRPGAPFPPGDALTGATGAIRFLDGRLQRFMFEANPPRFAAQAPPNGIVYLDRVTGEVVAVIPAEDLSLGLIDILFHFFEAASNDGIREPVDTNQLPVLAG